MNEKILLVDDDLSLLQVCAAHVRHKFPADTSSDPNLALEMLQRQGPYAVVISDREMPQMDGVQFLTQVKETSPDTVRIIFTGHAELESTIALVNDANLFRFLTKPCPVPALMRTLEAAIQQYRLVIAERELLEKTLSGSERVLMDVLSMLDPQSFARAQELRGLIEPLARALNVSNYWEIETAVSLSRIGFITIPPSVTHRDLAGQNLEPNERALLASVPNVGHRLLANIPRLESAAAIIRYQQKRFDGTGFPGDDVRGAQIPLGARMLKIANDYLQLTHSNNPPAVAIQVLQRRAGYYDPRILEAFAGIVSQRASPPAVAVVEINARELRSGDVLLDDLETEEGLLLLRKGQAVTLPALEKIRNFLSIGRIKEPISIRPAVGSRGA